MRLILSLLFAVLSTTLAAQEGGITELRVGVTYAAPTFSCYDRDDVQKIYIILRKESPESGMTAFSLREADGKCSHDFQIFTVLRPLMSYPYYDRTTATYNKLAVVEAKLDNGRLVYLMATVPVLP